MHLSFLVDLYDAVRARNEIRVHLLLRAPEARRLPAEVREEALAMLRLPAASLRAPMQLLVFLHRMERLHEADVERDDAPRPTPDPAQLDLPLVSGRGG